MKSRYRLQTRLFRKPLIVLQIAERKPYNYDPATDIGPDSYVEVWRDATLEDLTEVEN